MAEVTDVVLKEFKGRMKIMHSSEDDNLKRLLSSSLVALKASCGEFGFDNEMGKELVFERARYLYNDSLEFFSDNFLTEIINLSISLYSPDSVVESDTEGGDSDGG